MEYEQLLPKKPENIALSFSGGGFRAAAYTLGCLSYMDTITFDNRKITSMVNFISSASGGTITSLAYTAAQRKGSTFPEFYKSFTRVLTGTNVVKRVFEIMEEKECWEERPAKKKNFINAFSIAYDELLFDKETFAVFLDPAPGCVKEVCANTTEFDNGMLFRFQNEGIPGNKFLKFTDLHILGKIKLADILSASSCFTVGFEPFMFPSDFTYGNLTEKQLQDAVKQDYRYSPVKDETQRIPKCFGLMDGGIDDNQGIDSFILAENRFYPDNNFGYDLYMTCDVSSNYTSGYDFPEVNKKNIFLKLSLLHYLIILTLVLGVSVTGMIMNIKPALSAMLTGITGFLLLISFILFIAGYKVYRRSKASNETYGIIVLPHIMLFLKMRLSNLFQFIASRATSAGYLAAVVFLKKIRRISYDRLFEKISEMKFKADGTPFRKGDDPSTVTKVKQKQWSKFVLQNALYLLSRKNDAQRKDDLKKEKWIGTVDASIMEPTPALQDVADLATNMDTTLWFDSHHVDDNIPAALIAAGQFTTCYNLLRYAFRFDNSDADWSAFQVKLAVDWSRFNKDPYWMYDQYHTLRDTK